MLIWRLLCFRRFLFNICVQNRSMRTICNTFWYRLVEHFYSANWNSSRVRANSTSVSSVARPIQNTVSCSLNAGSRNLRLRKTIVRTTTANAWSTFQLAPFAEWRGLFVLWKCCICVKCISRLEIGKVRDTPDDDGFR